MSKKILKSRSGRFFFKNKKGVFFTFIAVFVVILVFSIITTKEKFRYKEKSNAISSRIRTINNFVEDFEKDLDRELYIGGYRGILSMNSYIRETEEFVDNFNLVFSEILENGTAEGMAMELMSQGPEGADIGSWLGRVNEETASLNIVSNIFVNEIRVFHISPWAIQLDLNATINISDSKGLASWIYEKTYSKQFTIFGFEDPLYTVYTNDKVTNLINMTPNTTFVDPDNNTDVLNEHILNSYYMNNSKAPSFLMRFEGNLSDSPYGIESMVNREDIEKQGLVELQFSRPIIDYIYFVDDSFQTFCTNLTPMPEWFRIDPNHRQLYGLGGDLSGPCSS